MINYFARERHADISKNIRDAHKNYSEFSELLCEFYDAYHDLRENESATHLDDKHYQAHAYISYSCVIWQKISLHFLSRGRFLFFSYLSLIDVMPNIGLCSLC